MRRPLLVFGGLFVMGEIACRMWYEDIYPALLMVLISGVIIWSVPKWNKEKMTKSSDYAFENKKSVGLLLFLCFVSGVIWNVAYSISGDNEKLDHYVETEEDVDMLVRISWIEKTTSGERLLLKAGKAGLIAYISDEEISEDCDVPGRYIRVYGRLEKLDKATNPGAMDIRKYYEGKDIGYSIHIKRVESVDYRVNIFARIRDEAVGRLFTIRQNMSSGVDEIYDEENAAIIKTMLLGDRSSLENETRVLYQRSGMAHVLAISGLHVALLAGVFGQLLKWLRVRRKAASFIIIMFVFAYGMMTGMSAPTFRAVLMLAIGEMAFVCGRTPDMPTTAVEALILIAIVSPGSVCAGGTLMSYAAVIGIICSDALYTRFFGKERFLGVPVKVRGVCKNAVRTILMSVSINAFMLPLVMRNYYEIPVFSMILNWMVIPMLTVVVASSMLSVLLGMIGGNLEFISLINQIPIWVSKTCLLIYKSLCRAFLKIPGGVFVSGHIEFWQMVIMYMVLGSFIVLIYFRHKRDAKNIGKNNVKESIRWTAVYCLGIFAIVWISVAFVRTFNIYSSEVVFLDVGQGDGSIIHISPLDEGVKKNVFMSDKHGRNYIVDGGSSSEKEVGKYAMVPALKYYAMTEIDCIFISHTDVDHVSGVVFLIENADLYGIKIKNVALASGTEPEENYQMIKSAIEKYNRETNILKSNLDLVSLKKGDVIDNRFEVLYPSGEEEIEHSGNDYSLVLKFKSSLYEILYTGDIGADAERSLLQELNEKESVAKKRILKVAHHGSKYSSCEEFLDTYAPDIAVISVGEKNMYGHPSQETLERLESEGSAIYRTDKTGAVVIE
ncbi:MAG: DNA internalization-related competence protein ComEC/Rec2 [Eubacterium sp.]|nr:DNA internalization-related competence protein ComEC/Rec2 [Eubacterium sp.]